MNNINIGPYDIFINKTRLDDDTFGEYSPFPHPVIHVDDRLSPKIESCTVLHEIFEAITDIYELPLTECHIRVLEATLAQVIKSNPKYFQTLVNDICGDTFDQKI
tara:strand:+ start:1972 stop:2286 length:315 start_codon:yes stop_codon:yes gene_type:complete